MPAAERSSEVVTTVRGASPATCTADTPPGSDNSSTASPPSLGSRQSAAGADSSPDVGRLARNSRSPSEVKTGADSPFPPRVSRRAEPMPAGSNSHIAVRYSVPSELSSLTVVTTRSPVGLTASPATLGRAR